MDVLNIFARKPIFLFVEQNSSLVCRLSNSAFSWLAARRPDKRIFSTGTFSKVSIITWPGCQSPATKMLLSEAAIETDHLAGRLVQP